MGELPLDYGQREYSFTAIRIPVVLVSHILAGLYGGTYRVSVTMRYFYIKGATHPLKRYEI